MAIDDLWYLRQRDPDSKRRLPSKRHGRGKRWRVRYTDASGRTQERLFEKKVDAETFDLAARSGVAPESKIDHGERRVTFRDYADRWRLSRESGWAAETRKRVPGNLRDHLYPVFGNRTMRSITLTDVLAWLSKRLDDGTPKTTLNLYFGVLKTIMNAAVVDKIIPDNPCSGVKPTQVLRGLSRAPKWVPTEGQVLRLIDVVPKRYKAAIWLGAGQALRIGEVLGMEDSDRCTDHKSGELHVVQQLRHSRELGGFFLTAPKAGSSGTVDLDSMVADHLAEHVRAFGPTPVELPDMTGAEPVTRTVGLLFTNKWGRPITDQRWSALWNPWREAAGWPPEGTFHSLRHFCATTMMSNGVDPQDVQRALRHANLRITLEIYVHWLPKKERPRGVVGNVLQRAMNQQDQS